MSESKDGKYGLPVTSTNSKYNALYPVYPMPPPPGCKAQETTAQNPQSSNTIISFPEIVVNDDDDNGDLVSKFGFTDSGIRRAFIRKVYSIILVQLLITGAIVGWFMSDENLQLQARNHVSLFLYIPLGFYFTTFFCILCCKGPRRTVPYNFIFLLMFTVSLSMIIGLGCMNLPGNEVVTAAVITFALVAGLTLFAFQTRIDFTLLTGSLFMFLLILVLYGIAVAVAFVEPLRMFYYTIGIIFGGFILIYDTQMIVGGKHRYGISAEEYVFGALTIYIDIMYIFVRILRIMR